MNRIHTILCPTDLSESARAAFQLACSFARDYRSRLVLLMAYPEPFSRAEAVDRRRADPIEEQLRATLEELKPDDPSVIVDYWVREGRPADVILNAARELDADLIVIGTQGRSGLSRSLFGSVAEEVTRRATCPVASVRAAARVPREGTLLRVGDAGPVEPAPPDPNRDLGGGDPVRDVNIPAGDVVLFGTLRWLRESRGVVLFAHGSGSSRHSPRNRYVADVLTRAGFATLLLDLLTEEEADNRENVFDIALLAERVGSVVDWVAHEPVVIGLPIGIFGASTGAAAALIAAARHPDQVAAVVSRGGRPDLAHDVLSAITVPTLLIVGGDDEPVLSWNREALARMTCDKELSVVPGATHLFEEPGALAQVATLAADWFSRFMPAAIGSS